MRFFAIVAPALVALALAAGCASGCGHGNHTHATGSSFEDAPDYTETCTCGEDGEITCGTAATSGGDDLAMN